MTDNRREFLTAAMSSMAALVLGEHLAAENGETRVEGLTVLAPSSKPIAQRDAPPINLEGWQMTASEVSYPPGESSGKHRHPGFVIGYVLEGQYRFGVNEQPPVVLNPGQMFFESFDAPGQVHAVSGNASSTQTTKILAIVFTKKGDPVTIPG
jgi:quercetin dioxygenase-like cupin family protein